MRYSDSSSDDDDEPYNDTPPADKMFAEFLKVKRQKEKFSCEFRNAILHINGKDFVIKYISGDILYWAFECLTLFFLPFFSIIKRKLAKDHQIIGASDAVCDINESVRALTSYYDMTSS